MKKKPIVRVWFIRDEIFNAHTSLFIGDYETYKKHMISIGASFEGGPESGPRGQTVHQKNFFVIWMREHTPDVLAHELCHHAILVFADRGVDITDKNHEAFAYYVEMWTRLINEALKRKPDETL